MTRIVVVGAGIAGLTTARALADAGLPCVVLEQADAPRAEGFGIQLATPVPGIEPYAVRPVARELRRWRDGTLITRTALPAEHRALRRADLHRVLGEGVTVRYGAGCVEVVEGPGGVDVRLGDGSTLTADLVIGADGLHSVVRAAVRAVRRAVGVDELRCAGVSAWRAVVRVEDVPWWNGPARVLVWLGPGQHCVCYPIAPGSLNVVATVPVPGGPRPSPADPSLLDAFYYAWHSDVRQLLAAARAPVWHGLFDRPALPRRVTGRVALVGDAAQPMLPYLAQGAGQAIEDATVLAAALRDTDLTTALARYEAVRAPRAAAVADAVRAAARDHHLPDGPDQVARDRRLASR